MVLLSAIVCHKYPPGSQNSLRRKPKILSPEPSPSVSLYQKKTDTKSNIVMQWFAMMTNEIMACCDDKQNHGLL